MPITCPIAPRKMSKGDFAKLDYQIMDLAFDSQNTLGRLCDEIIYQNDLAARIEAAGLGPVRIEVPLTVTYLDFSKIYSMDLVVADSAVYELKTATALSSEHDAQLLNYLLLWKTPHGKLVNFRSSKVASRFVNNPITAEAQKSFQANTDRWREFDPSSKRLRSLFLDLLADWGAFLELPLYSEALIHFLGGEQNVIQMVPLHRNGIPLGNQRMHLLTPEIAFRLTALNTSFAAYENHLHSILRHSPLKAFHWINMDRHNIQFVTVEK
jgi:GxxExxY protein